MEFGHSYGNVPGKLMVLSILNSNWNLDFSKVIERASAGALKNKFLQKISRNNN
jgi:hypothetical protein